MCNLTVAVSVLDYKKLLECNPPVCIDPVVFLDIFRRCYVNQVFMLYQNWTIDYDGIHFLLSAIDFSYNKGTTEADWSTHPQSLGSRDVFVVSPYHTSRRAMITADTEIMFTVVGRSKKLYQSHPS